MPNLFDNYGILTKEILSLTPRETRELVNRGAFLIDLRDMDFVDYKAFDIPHVLNLPLNEFEQSLEKLDKGGYYILADTSGLKSREFVQKMLDKGFMYAGSMSGGFLEWERDGLPVRVDVNERLSGSCACQLKPREQERHKQ